MCGADFLLQVDVLCLKSFFGSLQIGQCLVQRLPRSDSIDNVSEKIGKNLQIRHVLIGPLAAFADIADYESTFGFSIDHKWDKRYRFKAQLRHRTGVRLGHLCQLFDGTNTYAFSSLNFRPQPRKVFERQLDPRRTTVLIPEIKDFYGSQIFVDPNDRNPIRSHVFTDLL